MHEGRFGQTFLDRVKNGPVVRAHVKSDEVPCAVMPWATSCGYGSTGRRSSRLEVLGVIPSGRGLPEAEEFIQLMLLKKGHGGVELESFKNSIDALLDFKSALPPPVNVLLHLGVAEESSAGKILTRRAGVVLVSSRQCGNLLMCVSA